MQNTNTILGIYQKRGSEGLPLERVYRHLFDPKLFLRAYGKIYRNFGAMTRGTTEETVDGMSLQKIHSIIELLKFERYKWTPVRRTEIPKKKGGTRPLGIPTWSDKLLQEVLRTLLEAYYEPRFSDHSHGFRPERSCHTALREIQKTWKGTVWFIEGDIKGAFDNVDHDVLLSIIRRDIHDGRLLNLIGNLLKAGYMEDWRYYDTPSGTPQGGIISPLLFNIYLNELDRWVDDTLIPAYTRGDRPKENPEYRAIRVQLVNVRKRKDLDEIKRLKQERRKLISGNPRDPNYRRLRYVRYADDFLLGFVGPANEAREIRDRLAEFLKTNLKLTLSMEKTLVTHASDDKAKFLGYEIKVSRDENLISNNGARATNGYIARSPLVPIRFPLGGGHMKFQRLAILTPMLVAVVVSLGSPLPCTAHGSGGHGGGAGHTFVGYGGFRGCPYGFRGGYGFYRYPGFYGYPWYGFGLGLGLGYGLGYGLGGYGYPYYLYAGSYPVYGSPVYTPPPPPTNPTTGPGTVPETPAGPAPGMPMRLTDSDMLLSIRVPPDAVVRINGERTNQNGPRREFISSGLSPGRRYTFVVSAQWMAPNGKAVELEQCVHVQGGERRTVDFLMPPPPEPNPR